MFQSLAKLFGSQKQTKQLVKAPPGQLFAWKRGVSIEATETTVIVPAELIRDDEKIGSIVETSDDEVMIRGSAQALVRAEHGRETMVYVTLPPAA